MKRWISLFLLSFFTFSGTSPGTAHADESAILARLEALEQEVKTLKRQLEVEREEKAKKAPETAVATASAKDGFSIKAPDDSFRLKIRGVLQADSRFFGGNKKDIGATDTFLVRRARPIFEGTLHRDFNFLLMPDFGSGSTSLVDGYMDYIYAPELKLRAGKFKEPFQLERLQSDSVAHFTETGLTGNLAPNRDVGVQISGDLLGDTLGYQVGLFNGSVDQPSSSSTDVDTNNDKDVAARLFAHPFRNGDNGLLRGLGLGAAVTHGHKEGGATPVFRSPGQVPVFTLNSGVTADGSHTRFSPQGYWYWGRFGVIGEYVSSDQELVRGGFRQEFQNEAWQLSGIYVLTGEDASFRGVKVRKPFDLSLRQWGAFEIAARYGELDLDDALFAQGFASPNHSITRERAAAVGLNWYLNNHVRLMLDYERTVFDAGGPLGEDRETENAVFTRFQIAY